MAPTIKIFHPITPPPPCPSPKRQIVKKKFLFWSFLSLLFVVCIWVHVWWDDSFPFLHVMTGPQVWQQIHTVFPMEPPQSFPVKLFRGRVFWLSFSCTEPSLRPPACWVVDLPFLCIYQLFPWLPKFLDSRNRLNLHFLAVRQAIPLPLLPFLPFNSQKLTVGNSVLSTVTPPL